MDIEKIKKEVRPTSNTKLGGQVVYAFIDSQNLNLGVRNDIRTADGKHFRYKGWNLDFGKFYEYLRSDLHVEKAFIFIGYMPDNQELYDALKQDGFELIYKPILEVLNKETTDVKVKGNIDAEMVMHAMINYPKYEKAIIVSGDGDFFCLEEYLEQNGKLGKIIVPNKWNYSSLIEKFSSYFINMSDLRKKLNYTHKRTMDDGVKNLKGVKAGIARNAPTIRYDGKELNPSPAPSPDRAGDGGRLSGPRVVGDGKGPKYFGM